MGCAMGSAHVIAIRLVWLPTPQGASWAMWLQKQRCGVVVRGGVLSGLASASAASPELIIEA